MTPTPEQWQDLLNAITRIAPDPFWSTATPIFTTLFAVFAGFALAQWRESAKAKREQREKRQAEVREQRSTLVNFMTRWSHGTDRPWKHQNEFAYWEASASEVALLVSLTGDAEDAPLSGGLFGFMQAWVERTFAAKNPMDDHGSISFEFEPGDAAEMEGFRVRLFAILRQWLDTINRPSETVTELTNLAQDVRMATSDRSASFARSDPAS